MPVWRLPNFWLLLCLVLQVLVYPWLAGVPGAHALVAGFDVVILLLALRAARATGIETRLGYVLLVPAVLLHVAAALSSQPQLYPISLLAQAAFHGFVVVCLLRYMLRDEIMTVDEMFAAAGLYVLLAFVFAYLFAFLEHLEAGSFFINEVNNPDRVAGWWELLYFSFTCLTSVGFGEITPVTDRARSLVMLEQMIGVLYLALVISRLVSMQASRLRN